jgi:ribonuclease HII
VSETPPASKKRKRRSPAREARRRRQRRKYDKLEAFDCEHLPFDGATLAGADEVGRGALAGPVVAAAVVLPRDSRLIGVDDSKVLGEDEREALFAVIVRAALSVGIGFSHPRDIDRRNILNASLEAMARAVANLRRETDVLLVDGRDGLDVDGRVVPVVKGDGKSLSIAAASVVAKVARDRLMRRLHNRHPAYNFLSNKGYGTKDHIDAIVRHGMAPIHRRSFCAAVVERQPSLFRG